MGTGGSKNFLAQTWEVTVSVVGQDDEAHFICFRDPNSLAIDGSTLVSLGVRDDVTQEITWSRDSLTNITVRCYEYDGQHIWSELNTREALSLISLDPKSVEEWLSEPESESITVDIRGFELPLKKLPWYEYERKTFSDDGSELQKGVTDNLLDSKARLARHQRLKQEAEAMGISMEKLPKELVDMYDDPLFDTTQEEQDLGMGVSNKTSRSPEDEHSTLKLRNESSNEDEEILCFSGVSAMFDRFWISRACARVPKENLNKQQIRADVLLNQAQHLDPLPPPTALPPVNIESEEQLFDIVTESTLMVYDHATAMHANEGLAVQ